jgi:hypothetical protein
MLRPYTIMNREVYNVPKDRIAAPIIELSITEKLRSIRL